MNATEKTFIFLSAAHPATYKSGVNYKKRTQVHLGDAKLLGEATFTRRREGTCRDLQNPQCCS